MLTRAVKIFVVIVVVVILFFFCKALGACTRRS
jgi:hypothetical protein